MPCGYFSLLKAFFTDDLNSFNVQNCNLLFTCNDVSGEKIDSLIEFYILCLFYIDIFTMQYQSPYVQKESNKSNLYQNLHYIILNYITLQYTLWLWLCVRSPPTTYVFETL